MEKLFDQSGTLEAILGRGVVSAYEAARLKRGTLLQLSDRVCGDPLYLFYNGSVIGGAEALIADGLFCVRVSTLSLNPDPVMVSAEAEDACSLLETRVRLASCSMTLARLEEVRPFGIVSFGNRYRRVRGAELLIAGIPAAVGTVCVNVDRWVFRVEAVLRRGGGRREPMLSGAVVSEPRPEIQVFDFARPDLFSRAQIETVALVHKRFATALRGISPELSGLRLLSVDQLLFREAAGRKRPGVVWLLAAPVAQRTGPGDSSRGGRDRRLVVQSDDAPEQLAADRVRELAAEAGRLRDASPFESVLVGFGEESLPARRSADTDRQLLDALVEAWKLRVRAPRLGFHGAETADAAGTGAAIPLYEMVLVVEIGGPDGGATITLIYPAAYLGKILHLLS
ncbi:hypothetical protein [Salinispira pacifica]